MAWLRNRWYLWLGVAVWLGTAAPALIVLAYFDRFGPAASEWVLVPLRVVVLLHLLTYLWLFWACPYLDAGSLTARATITPRWRLLWLQALVWGPAELAAAAAVAQVVQPLTVWLFLRAMPKGVQPAWRMALLLAAVALALAPPSYWLTRRMRRRLIHALVLRRECFTCGYDLRGSPGATCPECGKTTTEST